METGLTDAVLHFLLDVATGAKPYFAYDGLNLSPDYSRFMKLINDAVERNGFANILQELEPSGPDYQNAKARMCQFQNAIDVPNFKDVLVTSSRADSSNKALLSRLQQLGIIDSIPKKISGKEISEKIKATQRMFNLMADGILRNTLRDEMNIPLLYRIQELKMTLNTIRWFTATTASSTIVIVNIPTANLLVYDKGKVIMESRVIVGKISTPTSTLSSRITEVILYPYWVVPKKIATSELLPIIQRNIGYLDDNAIQVINLDGKVVNPFSINWKELSPSYFPYVLRQSTGCDNSLGLVKLNFYNPFTTYLHDTPWKSLFQFKKRYFSHGCVRVEKAIELARLLLRDNQVAIDTVTEKGCLRNQSPITIQAGNAVPVFVLYQTAWVDSSGTVGFQQDVYKRLRYLRSPTRLTNKSLALK
jgi:murein L,D-transpeptidase YcbB/YkuD